MVKARWCGCELMLGEVENERIEAGEGNWNMQRIIKETDGEDICRFVLTQLMDRIRDTSF